MHVEYIQMEKINIEITLTEIFSEDFLSILITLSSIVYFLIATENRLNLISQFQFNQESSFKIKNLFEKNHYDKVKKMKKYIFSELLHAKTVNILQSYFRKNPVLNHLTNSYMKNYRQRIQMEEIAEEDENNLAKGLQSGTESFIEYSFDNQINPNKSVSIVNPFKPELHQISEEFQNDVKMEALEEQVANLVQKKVFKKKQLKLDFAEEAQKEGEKEKPVQFSKRKKIQSQKVSQNNSQVIKP